MTKFVEGSESARRESLRGPFLSAFVLAVFGSGLLSITDLSWTPALWALACMAGFHWFSVRVTPEQVRTEDYADNFYYLGFLLTLAALVIVLIKLGFRADGADDLFKTVLSQFGLALVTTLVGLAGRTVLLMDRGDEGEIADRARASLENSYDELTISLGRVTDMVEVFSGGFNKTLNASLESIDDSIRRFKRIIEEAADQIEPAQDRLVQVTATAGNSIGRIGDSAESLAGRLSEASSGIEDSIHRIDEQTGETLKRVGDSAESLAGRLSEASSGIEDSIHRIDEQTGETLNRVGNLADHSSQMLVEVRGQFELALNELQVSISGFRQQVAGTGKALEALPGKVDHIGVQASETVAQGQKSVRGFYQQLDALIPALRTMSTAIVAEGESIRGALGEWGENVEAMGVLQKRMLSESEGTTRTIRQVRDEVAEGVEFLVEGFQQAGEGQQK